MTDANYYTHVFKSWQTKVLGPKPTAEMLANIHGLGARPGKQALANAMALRDCGVTGSQIVIACGAPQLNKLRGFITDALLKREAAAPSPEGHKVYKVTITAKGLKRIESAKAKAAALEAEGKNTGETAPKAAKPKKAAKATAKAKGARKAKPATPVAATPENGTSEPATVTEGHTTVDVVAPVTELPVDQLST